MKRRKHNVLECLPVDEIEDIIKEIPDIADDDEGWVDEPTEEMLKEAEYYSQFRTLTPEEENAMNRAKVINEFIYKYIGNNYYEESCFGITWYNYDSSRVWINKERKLISPDFPNREIIVGTEREDPHAEIYICVEWEE